MGKEAEIMAKHNVRENGAKETEAKSMQLLCASKLMLVSQLPATISLNTLPNVTWGSFGSLLVNISRRYFQGITLPYCPAEMWKKKSQFIISLHTKTVLSHCF